MAKKIFLKAFILLCLPNFLCAQEENRTMSLSKMCILQATISPGYMFSNSLWNSYFHASLEWCFDNKISIRADGSYFFSSQGNYQPLNMNHSLLLGAFYHFPKKKCDFYVGLQPGAAMVQQNSYTYNDSLISNPRIKVAPIMTATVGANYFFWKYMNLFIALKYVHGTHISDYGNSIPLDELRISGGLGWQLQFNKQEKSADN